MRFLLVLTLFSIPLVYAGLGNLGGVSHLMEHQRLGRVEAANHSPADLLKSANITSADQVDDNIGLASSGSAVPVQDPVDALNNGSTVFANAQLTQGSALDSTERTAALEDSTIARTLTSTSNAKNPEEIIGIGGLPGDKGRLLRKAAPVSERKLNIF